MSFDYNGNLTALIDCLKNHNTVTASPDLGQSMTTRIPKDNIVPDDLEIMGVQGRNLPAIYARIVFRVGAADRIGGRGDDAHIGPRSAKVLKALTARTRDTEHVAEGREDHVRQTSKIKGPVYIRNRGHADGAARTRDEAQVFRKKPADAVAPDGVGVGAADLHEGHLTNDSCSADRHGVEQPPDEIGVAVFVNIFHCR